MTSPGPFESSSYKLARAYNTLANRVRDLERKDNAIFEVKTTTGRPTARGNYHFVINTFDNTVEVYADGSWEDLIGAGGGYTDEDAQDAVGNILADTATIDFTYDDGTPEITADVIPGGVDHDSLLNFVGNEHIDHTAVTLTAGAHLTGGGDISANRSFAVDDDFVLNTGDTIGGDLTFDGAFHPIIAPGSDTDGVLIEVTVTGTPQMIWDESEDAFSVNTGFQLSAGPLKIRSQNELRFYDNGNYVGFEAPALSADQIWVLPNEDGDADDFLQTDGAGNLTWAAGGGGGGAQFYSGTYTGDGTTSQGITGVGFAPEFVMIWTGSVDGGNAQVFVTSDLYVDDDANGISIRHRLDTHYGQDNTIVSLDADGFTVDDNNSNNAPNASGATYYFICLAS